MQVEKHETDYQIKMDKYAAIAWKIFFEWIELGGMIRWLNMSKAYIRCRYHLAR